MKPTVFLFTSFLVLAQVTVWGQIPQTMSYQGILKDAGGVVVPDGDYHLDFRLYDAPEGGNELWFESHFPVRVNNGIFNVILGSFASLDGVSFSSQYWLGVTVEGEAELTPRTQLTASPYSLTSRSVLGNSNIFPSDGNVGIGTTGPEYKLDVNGEIRATGAIYANANNTKYFQGGDDAALYDIDESNTIGIYGVQDNSQGHIKLGSNGPIISGSDGKLGIGTTSPEEALHVAGNIRLGTEPSRITFKTTGNDEGVIEHLEAETDQGQLRISIGDDGGSMDNIAFGYYWHEDQSWQEKMRIAMDGKVGIGTGSPQANLHISGDWILGSSSSFPFGGTSGWLTSGSGNLYEGGGGGWAHHFSAYGGGDIVRFGSSGGSGHEPDTKVVISNDGNVGIGTTGPTSKLYVSDNTAGAVAAVVEQLSEGGSKGLLIQVADEGVASADRYAFKVQSGSGLPTRFVIGNSGNVGIGTTSPNSTFETNGSFAISSIIDVSSDYTITATDYVIKANSTNNAITITLPSAEGIKGRKYIVKKTSDANTVTVSAGGRLIDGSGYSNLLTQYDFIEVISDGTNWVRIGGIFTP